MSPDNLVRTFSDEPSPLDATTTQTTTPLRSAFPNFQRAYESATEPKWPAVVVARLTDLLKLQPGWDSYNAPALKFDAAMFVLTVMQATMGPKTPVPSVVPSSSGGIQIEWHESGLDLEIHVVAPYEGDFWWKDLRTGIEYSGELSADFSDLREPVSRLSGGPRPA